MVCQIINITLLSHWELSNYRGTWPDHHEPWLPCMTNKYKKPDSRIWQKIACNTLDEVQTCNGDISIDAYLNMNV